MRKLIVAEFITLDGVIQAPGGKDEDTDGGFAHGVTLHREVLNVPLYVKRPGTPDGRRGWADYFLTSGYAVYVVDQPGRGRSGFISKIYGEATNRSAEAIADRFTAPERVNLWPQARLQGLQLPR